MATDTIAPAHTSRHELHWREALSSASLPAVVLFLGTFLLYWTTRTAANTFDAVSYANQIAHLYPRTGDPHWLFHPHHLLFNALGYVLWKAARFCGYPGGSLPILQSLNAVLGAAGVSIYYFTLRRLLQRSRGLPLLIALGLALSFGYWICATDGRVNMPSLFLMLLAFSVLSRLMTAPRLSLAALTGLLAGGAALFHESAGLFVAVGLSGVLLADGNPLLPPEALRNQRRQMALVYFLTWTGTTVLLYLVVGVFVLHLHSVAAFRGWTSEYSELGWWWDFHVLHNLGSDFYALRHAGFVEPGSRPSTFTLSPHLPALQLTLYGLSVLGWLGAAYAIFAALPQLWRSHNRSLVVVLSLWIVVYAAFFTVWSPGYFVFWVPVLVPAGVLLALTLAHHRARRGGRAVNWLVGIWIALYAALNLQVGILPHLSPQSDPFRRIAADVRAHTLSGDIVLVAGAGDGGPCEVALPYFADRDVISLHGLLTKKRDDKAAALSLTQFQISSTLQSGHAVYALDDVVPTHNARALAALSAKHHLTSADLKSLLSPYVRSLAWQSPRGPIWRLTQK